MNFNYARRKAKWIRMMVEYVFGTNSIIYIQAMCPAAVHAGARFYKFLNIFLLTTTV